MAKKDKNIYNIQNMNCEIDYVKLAKAIVKAQKEAAEEETKPKNKKVKITFKMFVEENIKIFRGKVDTKDEMTKGTFALINSLAFKILAWISLVSSVLGIPFAFYVGFHMQWSLSIAFNNIIQLFWIITVSFAMLMLSIILKGTSNEIEKEQDKNF